MTNHGKHIWDLSVSRNEDVSMESILGYLQRFHGSWVCLRMRTLPLQWIMGRFHVSVGGLESHSAAESHRGGSRGGGEEPPPPSL